MANPWTTFNDLLSRGQRTIARVISTDPGTGKIAVAQIGDSMTVHVESNGSAYLDNSYVFIENGIITGQAPNIRVTPPELLS